MGICESKIKYEKIPNGKLNENNQKKENSSFRMLSNSTNYTDSHIHKNSSPYNQNSSVQNNFQSNLEVKTIITSKINYKKTNSIDAHKDIIVCLIELYDRNIASCSYDKTIKIWNKNTYQCDKEIITSSKVFCLLEFEPGKLLCGTENKEIELYDIKSTTKQDIVFQGHLLWVNCLAKCDEHMFASGSNDTDIRIWDYSAHQQSKVLSDHSKEVLTLIQLKDGRLCSGSADLSIKIWNWKEEKCDATLIGHLRWVKCILELSNGKIISGSDDKTIRVWDIDKKECLAKLIDHKKSVRSLCELSDECVASASFDGTIKIWDLNQNECIQTLTEHSSKVICLLNYSGILISASGDKTIKLWENK